MNQVDHPAHYTAHPSGVEVIEITEQMGFCLGNAFKYLARAGLKGDLLTDLRKALWYIEREARRELGSVATRPWNTVPIEKWAAAEPDPRMRRLFNAIWFASTDPEQHADLLWLTHDALAMMIEQEERRAPTTRQCPT